VNVGTDDRSGPVLGSVASPTAVATTDIYAEDYQAAQRAADALIHGQALITP